MRDYLRKVLEKSALGRSPWRMRFELRRIEERLARIEGLGGMAPAPSARLACACWAGAAVTGWGSWMKAQAPLEAGSYGYKRRSAFDAWAVVREAFLPDLSWAREAMVWGGWGICAVLMAMGVGLLAARWSWRRLEPARPEELGRLTERRALLRSRVESLEMEKIAKPGRARGASGRL